MRFLTMMVAAAVAVLGLAMPGAAAAADWVPAGTACSVKGGAGEACAYLEFNGTAYRVSMQLTPAAGAWMQPGRYATAMVERGSGGSWCKDTDGQDVDCAQQTAAWNSGWLETTVGPFVLIAAYTTSQGPYSLYAGDTGWDRMTFQCATDGSGKVCATLQGRFYAIGSGESYAYPFKVLADYTPAAGQSITPESATVVADADSSTVNLCAPSCTAHADPFSAQAVLGEHGDSLTTMSAATTFTDASGEHTVSVTF
jgi:hypothetical protein